MNLKKVRALKYRMILIVRSRVCMFDVNNLWLNILEEAHDAPCTIQLGKPNMYNILESHFWWFGVKKRCSKVYFYIFNLSVEQDRTSKTN